MRPGEHLAAGHVAPAVGVDPGAPGDAEAEVGALGLDPDLRAPGSAARPAPPARAELAPGRDRVRPVQEQRPGDEGGVVRRRSSRPAGRAPGVGQSVPHQRRASAPPERPPGARHARRSAPGRRRPARWCWPARRSARRRRARRPRASSSRRGLVEVALAGVAVEVGGQRRAARGATAARRRGRAGRGAAPSPAARPASSRRCHAVAGADLQAPVAEQRGEGVGIGAAASSWRLQLGEVLGQVRAQRLAHELALGRRGHPVAAEELLLARSVSIPEIVHDTASRSNSSSVARCRASSRCRPPRQRLGVLRRAPGSATPRRTSTLPSASRYSLIGAMSAFCLARWRLAAAHAQAAPRPPAQLRGDVAGDRIGVAGPRHRRARARPACGSRRAPARCRRRTPDAGTRGPPLRPVWMSSV